MLPKRIAETAEDPDCIGGGILRFQNRAHLRPRAHDRGKRGEASLRMVCRPRATKPPRAARENQPLPFGAARPPDFPGLAQIPAPEFRIRAELATLQKSAEPE